MAKDKPNFEKIGMNASNNVYTFEKITATPSTTTSKLHGKFCIVLLVCTTLPKDQRRMTRMEARSGFVRSFPLRNMFLQIMC